MGVLARTLVEAGLPDLSGAISTHYHGLGHHSVSGEFSGNLLVKETDVSLGATADTRSLRNVTRTPPVIYDNINKHSLVTTYGSETSAPSQRVQPPSLKLLPCIKF